MTNKDTVISFNPAMGVKPIHLDGFASAEAIAKAVTDLLARRHGVHPDGLSVRFEEDGRAASVRYAMDDSLLTNVVIAWPAQPAEDSALNPDQLYANLLLAVENVIAAGHLDWDSGLDVDGIQSRAHAALVEAYKAVTK